MERNKNILPSHWQLKKLGEVCQTTSGGTPSRQKSSYYNGNIPWVKSGELDRGLILDTEEKISQEAIKNSSAKVFPKGTLLIALYGATIGKLAFLGVDAATNQAICGIFKNDNIDSNYLYHFLFYKKPNLVKQGIGGAQPNISQGILKNLDLPIPPLPEQQDIVAKIEELLSELENGKQQLLTAQQQLKVYRQSLLKWAFEGKLTNKSVKEGELPKNWRKVQINDVAETFGGYAFKSGEFLTQGKYQVLRMGNVRPGVIRYSESPVYLDKVDENVLNRALLQINDVIITQTGTRKKRDYGFTVLIQKPNLVLNQRIASIRFNENYLPKFFLYFSWTDLFKDQFFANETGNVGQGNVGMKAVTETLIPFPSYEEQQLIVSELESKLTICDKIEETISQSLQQAETLKQSILKKAFEGKLVTAVAEQREAKVIPLYKPKSEYFYQMQLLGIVAKTSKQKQIEHGEMTLAKYAYLMDKAYDIPTYFNYNRWHLGPYPPTIKKVINNKQYFRKSGNHIEVLNEKTLFNSTNPYTEKMQSAVNDLTDIFSKYSTKERSQKTELLATICKVLEDIQSTNLKAVRQSMAEWKIDLKGEKHKTKAEKFNEQETEKCLAFIKEKGWDKKLMK